MVRILVLDNYDSFVYNLVQYVGELGAEPGTLDGDNWAVMVHPEDIAAAAVNRMSWDGAIPPDAILVSVADGVVTLTGNVDHAYQRIAALWAVQSLWGVRDVDNQVAVLGPLKKPVDPNQISDDIRRALNRGWFAADTVHVRASGGTVTLSGSAETLRDRNLAPLDRMGRPRHHHGREPHPHRLSSQPDAAWPRRVRCAHQAAACGIGTHGAPYSC